MHIKCVVLDGFKSYMQRVTVGDFDPHFNAITGFNGSGKSNILDGIAFVLGLSSLSNVRANTLTDLIYKGGNIKRASVSIVFDNTDKARGKCPIGYEKYEEIIVSRSIEEGSLCRYTLNSVLSTKKAIQDMFESVSLNVNSPNFMIQQGKITKVVNMKPKETLGMIEESVGAAVYQSKRDKSFKELEEKSKQLEEVKDTLQNIVQPALRRQQGAYQLYEQYKIVERKKDELAEKYAICAYRHNTEVLVNTEAELQEIADIDEKDAKKLQELEELKIDKLKRQEEIKKEINKIVSEKLSIVEKELSGERKKVATHEAVLESAQASRKECEIKLARAQKAHAAEVEQASAYDRKSGSAFQEFEGIKADIETAKANLASAQQMESDVNAGRVVGKNGETFDLRERLVLVDKEIGKIRPQLDHESRVLENDLKSLRQKEAKLRITQSDAEIDKKLKTAEQQVNSLRQQLVRLNIDPEETGVDVALDEASNRLNVVGRERRRLYEENYYLQFDYSDPTPNFDRSLVHGCVYQLFETTEQMEKYKVPFEVGCAGSFGIVVVDNPDVSKAIIKHGNVAHRKTYMPLSVIRGQNAPPTQAELDRKLGPGKAVPALSLIRYDPKYDKLMKSYMSRIVLCDNMATAKIVAFQMKLKGVTLEGDVCDCDGTMQGGTRRNVGKLVATCQALRRANLEYIELEHRIHQLRLKVTNIGRNGAIVKQYEQATRNLENLKQERQCTAYAALAAEVAELTEAVAARKAQVQEWAKEMSVWQNEHKELTATLDSLDQVQARNLKQAKAEVQKWTKELAAAQKKYEAKNQTFNKMELDHKAKQAMIKGFEEDIKKAEVELAEAREDEAQKQALLDEANAVYNEKKSECDEVSEERRVWDEETSAIDAEIKGIVKAKDKLDVVKIKRDKEKGDREARIKDLKSTIRHLLTKYAYMDLEHNVEEHNQLHPRLDIKKCKRDLDDAEAEYDDLRTKIDPEAAERLNETKEQERNAVEKVRMLRENKKLIMGAIDNLDTQKIKLLQKAFHAVNAEFGKMMNTLLPEATARLVPVSENNLEDGLHIHVQLGGVWKESLTELSGGQRSLVALALVLSLCMYQPAPFYVLDEIDSALDLSHTQNIGVLIQQRFKDTQFICVSLKDGMYSNANVLFTTQFNDGKSTVVRSARRGAQGSGDVSKYQHVGTKRQRGGGRR